MYHKKISRERHLYLFYFYYYSPGRADFRGVGLTVFPGALWLAALWIQVNHCANTHFKQTQVWVFHSQDVSNVLLTILPEQQHNIKMSKLVLRLIPYQRQRQLLLPWRDKRCHYGLTVSRNLWIKGSLDHTISLHSSQSRFTTLAPSPLQWP